MANVDVIMPQMGESITEGTLVKWLKKEGDTVERDEPLFEISTEKVDVEIPSPAAGVLLSIKVQEGLTVPVNTVVAVIDKTDGAKATAAPAPQPILAPPATATPTAPAAVKAQTVATADPKSRDERLRVRSSPLVRKIAREHSLDIADIAGTGLSGRVTKNDILAVVEGGAKAPARPTPAAAAVAVPAARAQVAPAAALVGRREPMSTMRKKIAEHMIHSRRTSAHVATVFEADMSAIVRLREKNAKSFEEKNGTKLTYTGLLAKCVVRALQDYPVLNASIDGDDVVFHEHVNLGIAVALEPQGLIVPVVKRAEEKNLLGLQRAVNDLAGRARDKKLLPDEVAGGTFTITNPGIFGGLYGIPIINQPQVAILGFGGMEKRPVVIDDAIAIRTMSYLSLSFDHRLIDGAIADQFMAFLKKTLQAMDDIG